MNNELHLAVDTINDFCRRRRIRKLSLFGSVLRNDYRSDSDIDVLVEFEPDAHVTLFDMGSAQVELSALLGREVDLKTAGFLSPLIRPNVLAHAQTIYERA